MKTDRLLIAIVTAIGLLVVAALLLFFFRQGGQDYGPQDTPQGVVRNYVLALEKRDYARAYALLRDAEDKPDFDRFRQDFLTRRVDPSNAAILIQKDWQTGEDTLIDLVVVYASSGPFGDSYRQPEQALLVRNAAGEWKLARMPYPYWGYDWYQADPLKPPAP
jgi:hypothetical protein